MGEIRALLVMKSDVGEHKATAVGSLQTKISKLPPESLHKN